MVDKQWLISVFDRLLDSVLSIYSSSNVQCNLILAGDFNSRTFDHVDYVNYDSNSNINVHPDN